MRAVLRIMAGLMLAYVVLCGALFVLQRWLIYFPQPGLADRGVVKMTLENSGERLQVSIRPHKGRRALMYFGGNAEDVSLDMPSFASAFPNEAIYLLNYRGYGGSTGNPSERALFADGLALFDRVHADHPEASCEPAQKLFFIAAVLRGQFSAGLRTLDKPPVFSSARCVIQQSGFCDERHPRCWLKLYREPIRAT